jgi:hypothetical protein
MTQGDKDFIVPQHTYHTAECDLLGEFTSNGTC